MDVDSRSENWFLIGYRGAGKTTVARLLAERLGWAWVDADQVLETRDGRTIREIFAAEGEAGFRDKETALLTELCSLKQHVIATGGGVVLRLENRLEMQRSGRIAWLVADPPTLWRRLQNDISSQERRPALTTGGLAEIEELLIVREPLYHACADVTVDTTGRSPEEVVSAILNATACFRGAKADTGR